MTVKDQNMIVAMGGAIMSWHRGQAYGQDLRDRVLGATGSLADVAARFGVSKTYVARARSRRRRLGEDTPGRQCNHMPSRLCGLEPMLAGRVQAMPDQTLAQLCQWVLAEHHVQVGVTTMWKTLARLGLSLKKRLPSPPNRSVRT
jgi:transposase